MKNKAGWFPSRWEDKGITWEGLVKPGAYLLSNRSHRRSQGLREVKSLLRNSLYLKFILLKKYFRNIKIVISIEITNTHGNILALRMAQRTTSQTRTRLYLLYLDERHLRLTHDLVARVNDRAKVRARVRAQVEAVVRVGPLKNESLCQD